MTIRKALYIITGLSLLADGLARIGAVCLIRNAHHPARHTLGGFICETCGQTAADLDGFRGHFGQGYVSPNRKVYDRTTDTVTVTSHYEPGSRGTH